MEQRRQKRQTQRDQRTHKSRQTAAGRQTGSSRQTVADRQADRSRQKTQDRTAGQRRDAYRESDGPHYSGAARSRLPEDARGESMQRRAEGRRYGDDGPRGRGVPGPAGRRPPRRRHRGGTGIGLILLVVVVIAVLGLFLVSQFFGGSKSGGSGGTLTVESDSADELTGLTGVEETAQITSYFTYGTSLCLEGTVELAQVSEEDEDSEDGTDAAATIVIEDAEEDAEADSADADTAAVEQPTGVYLVMRYASDTGLITDVSDICQYTADYTIDGSSLTFTGYTSINEGIDLDDIEEGSYLLLLKVQYSDGSVVYYTFANASGYTDAICYYTMTQDDANLRVDVDFAAYNGLDYLYLDAEVCELPEDVYDIVIDAGHGGTDVGAVYGSYYESDLMLTYALALQESLEAAGYKVMLTRDGTEDADENMAYTMYDEDGRVNVACASGAKYCLSLHLNSNDVSLSTGGVQCYISCRAAADFASLLVDNIVSSVGTAYSSMESYRITDGVYARAFTESEIEESALEAQTGGYEVYDLTTDTDYYFMIRELGGVATNAYVDGRNTIYGTNLYYDSLQGVESYILELGFISVDTDLQHILNDMDDYVSAITESFVQLQEGLTQTETETETDTQTQEE